jgi:hypothetical protein
MKKVPLSAALAAILISVLVTSRSPTAKEPLAADLVVNGNF